MRAPDVRYHCPREWESLAGDDVRRHCPHCDETVTNLSALEPAAAQRFVQEHPEACLRFRADVAGRIVFDRHHLVVLATAATLAACTSWQQPDELAAPTDLLALERDDASFPDDDPMRAVEEDEPTPAPAQVGSPLSRDFDGASSVPAAEDPDPPELRRAERPTPQLSRRELRDLRRRFRRGGRVVSTMGR